MILLSRNVGEHQSLREIAQILAIDCNSFDRAPDRSIVRKDDRAGATGELDELYRRSNQVDRSKNVEGPADRRENVSTLRAPVTVQDRGLPAERAKEREIGGTYGTGTQKEKKKTMRDVKREEEERDLLWGDYKAG